MKFSIMRRIDFTVGFLLCGFLALVSKTGRKNKHNPSLPQNLNEKKLLLMKFLGFGSILMTTPMIRELKRNYPSCKIHFLTFKSNIQVCHSIPFIDKTLYLEKDSYWKFLLSFFKCLLRIRREDYEVVFNLEFFSNFSLFLSSLSGARQVVCFGGRHEYRKTLCQHIVSYENKTHVVSKFYNFARVFISSLSEDDKRLTLLEEDHKAKERIITLFKDYHIQPEQDFLVVVNINASEMSVIRKWPFEYYQKVILYLLEIKGVKIILIGAKEDISYVSQLERKIRNKDRVINLAGQISIKELISLLKQSHLYLGNDSGPLHIAEACEVPSISFFGPESPDVYGHSSDKNTIFYSNLPCSPCLNVYTNKDTRCKRNLCLEKITPEQVIKVLQKKYF